MLTLLFMWGFIGTIVFFNSKETMNTLDGPKKFGYGPGIWLTILVKNILDKEE